MKISNSIKSLLVLVFLLMAPVSKAEIPAKVIAFACSGCHGTDGQLQISEGQKLAGQQAMVLQEKLLAYKYNRQVSSIMGRIAKGYSDSEIKAVAQYFSAIE